MAELVGKDAAKIEIIWDEAIVRWHGISIYLLFAFCPQEGNVKIYPIKTRRSLVGPLFYGPL